ncbi:MAG: hypothetical protein JNL19_01800 [Burkholderiales bacterium]|nr:hypothetical protein [Burkholderiales bacterium]
MKTVIKPQVVPRDLTDAILSTVIGMIQIAILFALPSLVVYLLSGSESVAWVTAIAMYVVFAAFSVTALELDDAGVRLKRLLGVPKFVPWSDMTSVSEAPRRELVVHGWLWQLFPSREITPSFSSIGHYKFQYGEKFFFFPPGNVAALQSALPPHLRSRTTPL